MFDFEKLTVYQKAKQFNAEIRDFISNSDRLDATTIDQLRRASFSVILNLAEGSGRFSKKDRRHFYVVSRSSLFEVVAILDVLNDEGKIGKARFERFYSNVEELSKIIFALIKRLDR